MTYRYSVTPDHEVKVLAEDGSVVWSGKPTAIDVGAAIPVPNAEDSIILLNWKKSAGANILRIDPHGHVLWQVQRPLSNPFGVDRSFDVYVTLHGIRDGFLRANSYAGLLDTIDLATGNVIASQFTK